MSVSADTVFKASYLHTVTQFYKKNKTNLLNKPKQMPAAFEP